MKPIVYTTILWTVLFSCLILSNAGAEEAGAPPFKPGEKLTFTLRWGIIHAGEATLEVHSNKTIDGREACHFVMTARTNDVIDAFYKVRDRIDAYTDANVEQSLHYRKKQKEGKHEKDAVVRFDWEKGTALYTNFGNPRDPIEVAPGTLDPLSAFYFTRTVPMAENQIIERPVTDGKKSVIGRVTVAGRETIETPLGTFDTFLLEPELEHVGGVFEKSDKAKLQVWVTADHRKIPVRVRSKVVIGSFIGDLVRIEQRRLPPEPQPTLSRQDDESEASTENRPGNG